MKQIIAVIKPWVVDKVIQSMGDLNFEEICVREVKGYGRQKNYLDQYRENEYSRAFVPKIEISIWCQDDDVEPCLLYTSPSPRDATLSRMPSSA